MNTKIYLTKYAKASLSTCNKALNVTIFWVLELFDENVTVVLYFSVEKNNY